MYLVPENGNRPCKRTSKMADVKSFPGQLAVSQPRTRSSGNELPTLSRSPSRSAAWCYYSGTNPLVSVTKMRYWAQVSCAKLADVMLCFFGHSYVLNLRVCLEDTDTG